MKVIGISSTWLKAKPAKRPLPLRFPRNTRPNVEPFDRGRVRMSRNETLPTSTRPTRVIFNVRRETFFREFQLRRPADGSVIEGNTKVRMINFERKILFALVLMGVAFLPALAVAILSLQRVITEQGDLVDHNAGDMILAERLRAMHASQAAAMPIFMVAGDPEILRSFDETERAFRQVLGELRQKERDADDQEILKDVATVTDDLYAQTVPGVRMKQGGLPNGVVHSYFSRFLEPLHEKRERLLDMLVASEAQDLKDARREAAGTVNRLLWTLGIVSLFALVVVVVLTMLVHKVLMQKNAFDRTQKALLDQETRVSQARKEAIEVVAHDLKTPLSSILMSAEMLKGGDGLDPLEGLGIIERSAHSMERLIMNLLDHAKIEAGQFALETADTDLDPLFRDLAKRFEVTGRNKGLRLVTEIDGTLPRLSCDAVRLEQVLTNLLGNAVKFTPANGWVKLKAGVEGDQLRIEVSDNGAGIAPADLPHIFERFWQARATAKNGNGLGLSIAKTVVEAHHGAIWVESEPGQGSRFFIRLPLGRSSPHEIQRPMTL